MASTTQALALIISTIALLSLARPVNVTAQSTSDLQPFFNKVIIQVHKAESAGATANEVSALVALLNKAQDAQTRGNIAQANETLNEVETKASQLETTASQRTLTSKILAYGSGGMAALLGTVAYSYGVSFWRKYRIKRTFQMRIIPK